MLTIDDIKDILNPNMDTTPRGEALRLADSIMLDAELLDHEKPVLAVFRLNIESGSVPPIRAMRTLHRVDSILEARAAQKKTEV